MAQATLHLKDVNRAISDSSKPYYEDLPSVNATFKTEREGSLPLYSFTSLAVPGTPRSVEDLDSRSAVAFQADYLKCVERNEGRQSNALEYIQCAVASMGTVSFDRVVNNPEYKGIIDAADPVRFTKLVRAEHGGESGKDVLETFQRFIAWRQGNEPLEGRINRLLELEQDAVKVLGRPDSADPTKTVYDAHHILALVPLYGMDQEEYGTFLSTIYPKYPTGKVDDVQALLLLVRQYDLNKPTPKPRITEPSHLLSAPSMVAPPRALKSALKASSRTRFTSPPRPPAIPSSTKPRPAPSQPSPASASKSCGTCGAPFTPVYAHHTRSKDCQKSFVPSNHVAATDAGYLMSLTKPQYSDDWEAESFISVAPLPPTPPPTLFEIVETAFATVAPPLPTQPTSTPVPRTASRRVRTYHAPPTAASVLRLRGGGGSRSHTLRRGSLSGVVVCPSPTSFPPARTSFPSPSTPTTAASTSLIHRRVSADQSGATLGPLVVHSWFSTVGGDSQQINYVDSFYFCLALLLLLLYGTPTQLPTNHPFPYPLPPLWVVNYATLLTTTYPSPSSPASTSPSLPKPRPRTSHHCPAPSLFIKGKWAHWRTYSCRSPRTFSPPYCRLSHRSLISTPPLLPSTSSAFAFTASLSSTRGVYWDNAASVNCSNTLDYLQDVTALPTPFTIGGIGSSVVATHIGIHSALPQGMNTCYYAPSASVTLLSIGSLCRSGGMTLQRGLLLSVYDARTEPPLLLDSCPTLPNNLSPVSVTFLQTHRSGSHHLPHALVSPPHYTPEQLHRADQVELIHKALGHPGDSTLSKALDHGALPTPCLSSDVRNNRLLRDPCLQCAMGKFHKESMPSSTTLPASAPGMTLVLDVDQLPCASPGGSTHRILIVDEATSYLSTFGISTKQAGDVYKGVIDYISATYSAHGHKVLHLHADAESVFKSLKPAFGNVGITLTLSPPTQHAQRVERYNRTFYDRVIATAADIPFHIPQPYYLQFYTSVAFQMNLTPTTTSSPSTPFELVHKTRFTFHPTHPFLPIGSTAMVAQDRAKRRTLSANHPDDLYKITPKSEIGVNMGYSPDTPGSYLYLLLNGHISPCQPPCHPPQSPAAPSLPIPPYTPAPDLRPPSIRPSQI